MLADLRPQSTACCESYNRSGMLNDILAVVPDGVGRIGVDRVGAASAKDGIVVVEVPNVDVVVAVPTGHMVFAPRSERKNYSIVACGREHPIRTFTWMDSVIAGVTVDVVVEVGAGDEVVAGSAVAGAAPSRTYYLGRQRCSGGQRYQQPE